MAYLRTLAIANGVLACLFAIEKVNIALTHPGVWGKDQIAEEIAKSLQADEVALSQDGEGRYQGQATTDGRTTFQVAVQQDPEARTMDWTAVPPAGRERSGGRGGSSGEMTKDSWLFVLFVNVALAAMLCGMRAASAFADRRKRDWVAWLGIPLFLGVLFFGSIFTEKRLGDDMPWPQHVLKWSSIFVLFFGIGLFNRHRRDRAAGRPKSISQIEREAEEAANAKNDSDA